MEANLINNCVLCQEQLEQQRSLLCSCKHCYCFKCYPYILFNTLKNSNISEDYFLNPWKIELNCLFCKSGKLSYPIPFSSLYNVINQTTKFSDAKINTIKEIKCESCEKDPAKLCCLECQNTNFCERCFDYVHKQNKKFSKHAAIDRELINQMLQPSQDILHSLCFDCKFADCSICMNIDDKNHQVRKVEKIFTKNNNFKYVESKSYMNHLLKNFSKFQEKLYNNAENSMKDFNKELDEVISEMIVSLHKIKQHIYEEITKNYENLKSQSDLIQKSLRFLIDEIENNEIEALHPNKLFQLNRYFNESKLEIGFSFKNFHIKKEKLEDLKKIRINFDEFFDKNNILFFEYIKELPMISIDSFKELKTLLKDEKKFKSLSLTQQNIKEGYFHKYIYIIYAFILILFMFIKVI